MSHGVFSTGLTSLNLQIRGLFDGMGGDDCINLLDKLAELSPKEQAITLDIFSQIVNRLVAGGIRMEDACGTESQLFVDEICCDIVSSFSKASYKGFGDSINQVKKVKSGSQPPKLSLAGPSRKLSSNKSPSDSSRKSAAKEGPIDLAAARASRVSQPA